MRMFLTLAAGLATLLTSGTAVAQSSPSDFTTGTRYDANRRVTGTIAPDPDNSGPIKFAAVRNTYDTAGRLTVVEKGQLTDWQSEAVLPKDWELHTTFSKFAKVETSYDAMDRKTLETSYGWDSTASAWVTGSVTQYSYDAIGRLECTALRMNPATYGSLPSSACTLATTGSYGPDRITKTTYDAIGEVLKVQKAYGVTTANGFPETLQQDYVQYSYSANGKQTSVTDANGNKASMTYDGFDRQTQWNFPDKTTPGTVSTTDYEGYSYDPAGNRLTLRKRDGRVLTYSYDNLNRMTSKVIGACPAGPPACVTVASSATRPVYYAYDLRGLQLSAVFDSASGTEGLFSSYDGFGRLSSSTNTMGGTSRVLGYQWDADGNRTRVTHPDGNYFVYGFDGLNRMTSLSENGSTTIATIAYDARGQRSSATRDGVTTSYTYDPVSRLASLADDLSGTAADVTSNFSYNPASQIIIRSRSNSSYAFNGYANVSRNYTTNGLNQYSSAGSASFTYDANGNLTGDGTTSFTYDAENRLIASSAYTYPLIYDPAGRLFQTGVKQFLYDGDELVSEYATTTPATVYKRYVHGPAEDDPWFWYNGSGVGASNRLAMQSDHQGSIVSVSGAAGTSINTYDEYGIPGSSNAGRFQYTGQAWLPEVGMYYYKARMYSPTLGRFMQTDPIGYKDQVNLYAYVGNDALNHNDPTGQEDEPVEEENRYLEAEATTLAGRLANSAFRRVQNRDPNYRRPASARSQEGSPQASYFDLALYNAAYDAREVLGYRGPDPVGQTFGAASVSAILAETRPEAQRGSSVYKFTSTSNRTAMESLNSISGGVIATRGNGVVTRNGVNLGRGLIGNFNVHARTSQNSTGFALEGQVYARVTGSNIPQPVFQFKIQFDK